MPIYLIIAPDDSTLRDEDVGNLFDDRILVRSDAVWLVKTPVSTCAEVRDRIRASPTPRGRTCVVVKAKEYNGYAKRDVWEKLEAWERD